MSMDPNPSSLKPDDVSSPDCASDPDEKEISDEDDDRNHKHRKRDTGSQSLERDPLEQASTQPFRKRNRTIQNGQSDPQFQHNLSRDFPKRRHTGTNFPRFSGQHGSGRGRGRDFHWDSRFGPIDGASQMAHFTGRGMPVPNAQNASWSGFGLMPNIPNGTIDAINPLGLPGILGPQMNPSMNMGIQRQRCRDFDERGFCLRGDMCPMEHGVNRIVVEDVQSLSHFNLPVSLPSGQMLGASAGSGFVSSAGSMMNSGGPISLMENSFVDEEALAGGANASGADVYDPDQPLWNNDARETSNPLFGLQPSNINGTVSLNSVDVGGQSTSSSVWGRLRNSRNKTELKEKFDVRTNTSKILAKETSEPSGGSQGMPHVGKRTTGAPAGPKTALSTSKLQGDVGGTIRKPSQKAECTLFVNCIPLKDNKRENLLSHFRKFGEVIDIYIPTNSERAFVQFSKREEADKALKAPDAVMGSRFIKLWWANRDNVAINGANNVTVISKAKDNVQYTAPRVAVPKASDNSVTAGNNKSIAVNSPRVAPPAQKKLESLEILKEELRKKQEMLERKRNEFRQQLEKLTKPASGKSKIPAAPDEKRQISETTSSNASKAANIQPSDTGTSLPPEAEAPADKLRIDDLASPRVHSKGSGGALSDSPISKQSIHRIATSGAPSVVNRYKLDNRPTTFRILSPLPGRLTNVAVLRDHFSSYGEISDLKIEDSSEEESRNDFTDSEAMRNCSAQVSFATRYAAEKAFLDGKSWHGHNLQFSWVTSSIPTSSQNSGESSSSLKKTVNTEVQSAEITVADVSQNTVNPENSNSSSPKLSHETSSDSLSSPAEKQSRSENQSPEKSIAYLPLEANEPENSGSEKQEEEGTGDDQKQDEDVVAS